MAAIQPKPIAAIQTTMRAARHIARTDTAQTDIALEATYLGPDSANSILSVARQSKRRLPAAARNELIQCKVQWLSRD